MTEMSAPSVTVSGTNGSKLPESLKLIDSLVVHPHVDENQRYIVEDTATGNFFRIGAWERQFMIALRDSQSASAAFAECFHESARNKMSLDKAERFCRWLQESGLICVRGADPHQPNSANRTPRRNPLLTGFYWKLPLINPDRWLCIINEKIGWIFSPWSMVLCFLVFVLGLITTLGSWGHLLASYDNLFSSWRGLSIGVSWIALKVLHEFAHGATCRRYGGEVKEAGIALILLMPIAFVNVTSSWRFPSRWQRLHVTIAGVAVELLVAGVALLVWHSLDFQPLKQAAADIVLMASVSSLLFNLNPLLKYDGYYALADATGIDNLYSLGQAYARYFGGRFLLGLDLNSPRLPSNRFDWIKYYGCAAAVYRVITMAGMLTAAAAIFHGAGIVLAAAGAFSFVLKPAVLLVRHLWRLWRSRQLRPIQLLIRTFLLAVLVMGPLWLIPASGTWTSPAIVQYSPPSVLRARSLGFVEQVHVVDGQFVVTGMPLVTLRNDTLVLELSRKKKELSQIEQEILAAQWVGNAAKVADAQARKTGVLQQLEELQIEAQQLVLRAPIDGRVISRKLGLLKGTLVKPGEELAVVGREEAKRILISISQTEAQDAVRWHDRPVQIIFSGYGKWSQSLTRIESKADTTPPDESLLANNSGSLSAIQQENALILCEPRVNAYIELTPDQSLHLRCGQRGVAVIQSNKLSFGSCLLTKLCCWLRYY